MPQLNGTEALVLGVIVALVLLIAWWILRRRPERVRAETPDVLTPGAAPAERNTLLVSAPPAAEVLGGIGELVEVAAAEEVAQARPEVAAAAGPADDLTRIKGLGPKLRAMLGDLGVTRFDQIAGWTDADIARIDPHLGAFQGRIVRDNWIEQARYLAADDIAGFEGRFGKI